MNSLGFKSDILCIMVPIVKIYSKDCQLVDLFIRSGTTSTDASRLIEIFRDAHVNIESCIGHMSDIFAGTTDRTKCHGYIRIPASQSREALSALYEANLISAEERSNSDSLVEYCEERVKYNANICEQITAGQEEMLREMFVDLYLESIADGITTLDSMHNCLKMIFDKSFAFLMELTSKEGEFFLTMGKVEVKPELRCEVWEAICALQKIYNGEANLESTLLRITDDHIPSLNLQKQIIVSAVKKMVFDKFEVAENDNFWEVIRE